MTTIIIVEDTLTIREELKTFLAKYGYEVLAPTTFDTIPEYADKHNADLILLDINLPVFDGYYICKEIRKTSTVPIIIVTSRDTEMDELMSLNTGADAFITKPYNTQILLAHIEAIIKRTKGTSTPQDTLTYNELTLNLSNGSVSYRGNTTGVTKNELKILSCLIKNKGTIVSRDELMEFLWTSYLFVDDNNLSVNMTRLRKKLDELGMEKHIETKRSLGYILP
ncbi:MAG: response regulator transcription factor [Alkalibacterium sp.]|nr:response regulator transcription factor [Alkalibacterium sp.]